MELRYKVEIHIYGRMEESILVEYLTKEEFESVQKELIDGRQVMTMIGLTSIKSHDIKLVRLIEE